MLSGTDIPYAVTRVAMDLEVAVRVPAHTRTCIFITTTEPALKQPSQLVLYFINKQAQGDNYKSSPKITESRAPACPLHLFSFMVQCYRHFSAKNEESQERTRFPARFQMGFLLNWR